MKFCKDCKWYMPDRRWVPLGLKDPPQCGHPRALSIVTGEAIESCYMVRIKRCGADGEWFEAKEKK